MSNIVQVLKNKIDFKSSNIFQIKYIEEKSHIIVIYQSDTLKEYVFCVKNDSVWIGLLTADSKGKFINEKLKNNAAYNFPKNCPHEI